MKDVDPNAIVEFTLRRKIILTLFCIAFPIMVWGVMAGGWWFPQMAASFLTITIVIMFISGLKEKKSSMPLPTVPPNWLPSRSLSAWRAG